nr:family 16 glycosylhydrolase [Salsipaludibacter albus]
MVLALLVPVAATAQEAPVLVVDDFESGLPSGTDGDGVLIGWNTFQDAASTVAVTTTDAPPAVRPDAPSDNDVLQLDVDVEAFAGVTHSFEDAAVTSWTPQDWSSYAGFAVWVFGQDTGTGMFIDVLDNRGEGSTTDDAERWSVSFVDDFSGWRLLEWEWDEFARKNIGNGAPDDGLNLTEVHGWAIGALTTDAAVTWYVDDAQVWGTRPLALGFDRPIFDVDEGSGEAVVTVRLTRPAEDEIVVRAATSPSTDRTSSEDLIATPDRDYVPTSATLTFPLGATTASFTVPLVDDAKDEVPETFLVELTDVPDGLDPGAAGRASVSIVDDDPTDPLLLEDVEELHAPALLDTSDDATMAVREIAAGDADGLPGQGRWEHVLDVAGPGTVGHDWAFPVDANDTDGLTLWLDGTGTGSELELTVKDDRGPDPGPDGWELAWSDEFDGPAGAPADPADWTYETGGWGWGNQELQYYTDSTDNAALDGDGNLVITAREVDDPAAAGLPCWYGDCTHTSARLITEGKREFGHGRWEARVKVAEGTGIWPAFWSLGNDFRRVGWPQTGEIDVMEFVGRQPTSIFGTIHGPGYSGGESYGSGPVDLGEPVGNAYHTFAVEWQDGLITWELDGVQYHTATPADVDPDEWVFDHPFTLLMNVALGGNFGGPLGDDLDLPQETLFDWVRVWSAPDTAERFTATITDDVDGWREVTVPWSAFERDETQPDGAPDNGLTLSELWGWELALPDDVTRSMDQLRLVEAACEPNPVVTSGADAGDGSLRRALERACDGATIVVDASLADTTVELDSQLVAARDVVVDASDAPGFTLSGGDTVRVLTVEAGAAVVLDAVTVTGGAGSGRGGGILNLGDLTIRDGAVVANTETSAGPPAFDRGGGGIWTGQDGRLELVRTTIADNGTVAQPAGGLYGFFGSETTITDSTISGNVAADVAGGIRSLGDVAITDSTISGNTSTAWHGGGMFVTDGTVDLVNVTVTDNTAPPGTAGGVLVASFGEVGATVMASNTILAGNDASGSTDCAFLRNGAGAIALVSGGGNVDGDGTCGLDQPTDQSGVDVVLGPLADNGGSTLTHLPADTSPVVDAGTDACDEVDQRGVERVDDTCDAGSVEVVVDPDRDGDADGVPDVIEEAAGSDPDDPASLPACAGRTFTLLGTLEDDDLVGTDGDDVILALDGDDRVDAGDGDDVVCGGTGADELAGGDDRDLLLGEAGNDVLSGGNAPDELRGGGDDDRLVGGNAPDVLDGGDGVDHADGGRGPDACAAETTTACEPDRSRPGRGRG